MELYIRAMGNISPQNTFNQPGFLQDIVEYTTNRLTCIEPDYKEFIDGKLIRRMSRIVKMGVAAALQCLNEAGINMPGAIVTGTAYGCMEDTGAFLKKMVEQNEEMLSPTAFIQSTHNTVGAQVALLLKCHNYNNTFVHRGFSFESALLDAIMLIQENEARNVLVGGIDEITNLSHSILTRFGLYKPDGVSNISLFEGNLRGTIAGEGAAFFLLSGENLPNNYAQLTALATFYKPKDAAETEQHIRSFLNGHSLNVHDIDLVITGRNGDTKAGKLYNTLEQSVFSTNTITAYKHLCGEYPTSIAFALWLAANIVKTGNLPPGLTTTGLIKDRIKTVLVYNHGQDLHHSLLLISAC